MHVKLRAAIALAALSLVPTGTSASTLVMGNGHAADCSHLVIAGKFDNITLDICNLAIDTDFLERGDRSKTLVNRSVVYIRRGKMELAQRDLDNAERLDRGLPEIFINRGAVLIRQKRFEEAVTQISKGLALQPMEPEKGYFNRAVAREALDDLQGAYMDFRRAAELKPDWESPKAEMARFKVETRK